MFILRFEWEPVNMTTKRLFAVIAAVAITLACSGSTLRQVAPPTAPTVQPAAPPITWNESVHNIEIGQVFQGTLRGDGAFCVFVIDGSEVGPCDRFSVVAPLSGKLTVHIAWDNVAHFLGITVPRAMSFPGIRCCTSPAESHIQVTGGQTTEFYVYFAGATDGPGGHVPSSAEQPYELVASLEGT